MADEQPAPLSAAEMMQIRQAVSLAADSLEVGMPAGWLRSLLVTLDAYREIVAAVAGLDDTWFINLTADEDAYIGYPCPYCRVDFNPFEAQHKPDCPVTRARALLGQEAQP